MQATLELPIGVLAGPALLDSADEENLIRAGDELLRRIEEEREKGILRKAVEAVWPDAIGELYRS